MNNIKTIVTLGPASNKIEDLKLMKNKWVDFVRINMCHSNLDDLEYFIQLAKEADIKFIIDTEGSQIRTGEVIDNEVFYRESDFVLIFSDGRIGNKSELSIKPGNVLDQLETGDLLYVDFDALVIQIVEIHTSMEEPHLKGLILSSGKLGSNKGIFIDSSPPKSYSLPTLTEKDYQSIEIGLKNNIKFIAASFIRSAVAIKEIREVTKNKMNIISKIECIDALINLDDIVDESDFLLIDRGDLSKEIPIEKIPFTQKIVLSKGKHYNTPVFVATNLLETMIKNRKPTRAEVHDILGTILDGADGLVLAAETAIGKYPLGCVNMLNKLIHHSQLMLNPEGFQLEEDKFVEHLNNNNYLLDNLSSSSLIRPHGGKLIQAISDEVELTSDLSNNNLVLRISDNNWNDLEQIGIGAFSPLTGFMTSPELDSVVESCRLPNNQIWTIPIILDITEVDYNKIVINNKIYLTNNNEVVGSIRAKDKFKLDKNQMIRKIFNTNDINHPGVIGIMGLNDYCVGGKINLYKKSNSDSTKFCLTPLQIRRLFNEKNWSSIAGFHTRNVVHRGHEFIQKKVLSEGLVDGLFIHPVIGKKKKGDFSEKMIIESYLYMFKNIFSSNQVVFSTFLSYLRYAGVREAIFTAIVRQNYGCSHFIIGRDHTGSGNKTNNQDVEQFNIFYSQLDINILKFDEVGYSKKNNSYGVNIDPTDKLSISGSKIREMLIKNKLPPEWMMRKEISELIINNAKNGEEIFIK